MKKLLLATALIATMPVSTSAQSMHDAVEVAKHIENENCNYALRQLLRSEFKFGVFIVYMRGIASLTETHTMHSLQETVQERCLENPYKSLEQHLVDIALNH